ncbi:maltase A2-like isoform X2 [Watersipora subatra]|uniref:maltase A2-like isoform X2 n=1 Tax=Watersipora subatra TaxID=2589382 RepID=UPI00355B9BAB
MFGPLSPRLAKWSWLILLIAIIYVTLLKKRCKLKPNIEWWQKASVYQVYPRSFKDSDGDGVGDINGIREKLDYLRELSIDAIWLSPFYESPMRDFGYDVINYTSVDPLFGNMSDLDSLIDEMHKEVDGRDLKLIIDFIPNHTSNESIWFQQSVDRVEPYTEYYIWEDCGNATHLQDPNNWQSALGTPAWTYHSTRQQCYFHQYQDSMPDLNYRNNLVKEEIDAVLRFWLDKNVDGIRIDAISKLYEDYNLRDEPAGDESADPNDYYGGYLNHTYTKNLPEIMDMINRWRGILDEYSTNTDSGPARPRVMVAEASGSPTQLKMYYGRTKDGGANFPFNFGLTRINESCDGLCIAGLVDTWMDAKPEEAPANWVLGNHDKSRITSRVGEEKLDALTMLLLTLPGVSTTYYGDEIGMLNINISDRPSQDPVGWSDKSLSRDPERSPMQWYDNSSSCYGFTSDCQAAWLPPHPDAEETNVQVERDDPLSHLSVYKNLSRLRREETFSYGDWTTLKVSANLYSYLRSFNGLTSYLVVVNMGDTALVDEDFSEAVSKTSATVAAITGKSSYIPGAKADLMKVSLQPGDGVVFSWPYIAQ